jgi:hypothetical protein
MKQKCAGRWPDTIHLNFDRKNIDHKPAVVFGAIRLCDSQLQLAERPGLLTNEQGGPHRFSAHEQREVQTSEICHLATSHCCGDIAATDIRHV